MLQAQKPHPANYIQEPKTLGEHIRKRRIDLGLTFKGIEKLLGISYHSISNWERDEFLPSVKVMPQLIEFLSYDPFGNTEDLSDGEKIRTCRKLLGLNAKEAAKHLGVTSATISLWENGRVVPTKRSRKRLEDFFTSAYCAEMTEA